MKSLQDHIRSLLRPRKLLDSVLGYRSRHDDETKLERKWFVNRWNAFVSIQVQYDLLLNVLCGYKMALRTLDFRQFRPTIAMLRERQARAPEAAWARFPWCDRKARCACFAVTHLRYHVVMGPWKQRSFHRYSYYRANSVTYSVSLTEMCSETSSQFSLQLHITARMMLENLKDYFNKCNKKRRLRGVATC